MANDEYILCLVSRVINKRFKSSVKHSVTFNWGSFHIKYFDYLRKFLLFYDTSKKKAANARKNTE